MKAIEIRDLSKKFKIKNNTIVEAVKNVSLTITRGEVFGFLGPNGAGKSTTIKMVMGLIRPSCGHISVMGQDATSHLSRNQVGYLPENPAFYDFLTAQEYLIFVGKTFGMSITLLREKVESTLKLLALWEARNRLIRGFSKGMVQRLGLVQALIHDPEVYILDEPMSGLDPVGRALVKEIILDLRSKGKSVFFSTHITSDVEAVCDRVGIILQGSLREVKSVDSIMAEGITGYQVRMNAVGSEQRIDRYVPKNEFQKFMKQTVEAGLKIDFIEPKRKDLESFFLDIVKGIKC